MNNNQLLSNYSNYYKSKTIQKLYPTEFIVRSFLGNYPELKPEKREVFFGKKVCDLGCGDGRNIPFLSHLGFNVFGIEIEKSIIDKCKDFLIFNNIKAELYVGRNNKIPFKNRFFDYLVACHSCYYLNENDLFSDNLNEIHRVLDESGKFVFSVPKANNFLIDESEILDGNYAIIKNDPLKIRNGTKIKFFESKEEIIRNLKEKFDYIRIGSCENNWWGYNEFCWTVICQAKRID